MIQEAFLMVGVIAKTLEYSFGLFSWRFQFAIGKNLINNILDIQKLNTEDHVFAMLHAFLHSPKAKKNLLLKI